MCIGIPMQVVEPMDSGAWCVGRDGRRFIDVRLVGAQPAGTWLLTHMDAAREVLTAEAARQIESALDAWAAALSGDADGVDAGFADLVGREPQLPEHLLRKENA